jgi:hypothetical protein
VRGRIVINVLLGNSAEGECVSLQAGIEESYLEGAVLHLALLADELVEPLASHCAFSIGVGVYA